MAVGVCAASFGYGLLFCAVTFVYFVCKCCDEHVLCGFCFWFFYLCVPWFQFAFDRQIKTEVGRLLMYPWMLVLPISMALTIVAFFIRGILGNTEKIK